jgi:hypothetical protein
LRVGDLNVLYSGNPALYSILRASQGEMVLVIVNLSDVPISGYKLSLDKSTISAGTYNAASILGAGGGLTRLTVNDQGGFSDYAPVPEIPAYGTEIIQLQP